MKGKSKIEEDSSTSGAVNSQDNAATTGNKYGTKYVSKGKSKMEEDFSISSAGHDSI